MARRLIAALLLTSSCFAQSPTLEEKGRTYARAQASAWINTDHLVVAKWDGTLTIFRPPATGEYGPVLTQALTSPSLKPVVSIVPVSPTSFITSNGDSSIALWTARKTGFSVSRVYPYDSLLGSADSGAVVSDRDRRWLVTGHANGFISVWELKGDKLRFRSKVSTRSPDPVPSPYQMWNVRGVVGWSGAYAVAGSEDGDLTLVDIEAGKVTSRMRYNPLAQRGINAISVLGDYLLVANCSVGSSDKNLWLYRIEAGRFVPLDAVNLVHDASRPQVFDFSLKLSRISEVTYFVASTEEALVWVGRIQADKLYPSTNFRVVDAGGASLALRPDSQMISAVAHDILLLSITPNKVPQ